MTAIDRRRFSRIGRPLVVLVACAGFAVMLASAPLGASAATKSKRPKLTFSGAVTGKAKGMHVKGSFKCGKIQAL